MGQFSLLPKKIEINDQTRFIIDCYMQALADSKFITYQEPKDSEPGKYLIVEGNNFDARLIATPPKTGGGIINSAIRKYEKFTTSHHGAQYVTLPLMEVDVDNDLENMYEGYVSHWSKRLEDYKFKPGVIVGEEVDDPHVLISHLLKRLIANILAEPNLIRIHHNEYFIAMDAFIKNATATNSPFIHNSIFDPIGSYLLGEHKEYISSFSSILKCRIELTSHLQSIKKAQDLMSDLERLIKRQIIAYWEPGTKTAQMANDYYSLTFSQIEDNLYKRAINSKVTPTQELQLYGLDDKRTSIIFYAQSKKQKFIKILPNLYVLLQTTQDLNALIIAIKSFIDSTGWIGFLGGLLNMSTLSDELQKFIRENSEVLDSSRHGLPLDSYAYSALMTNSARDLTAIASRISTISSTLYHLNDSNLHSLIKAKILGNIKQICTLQQKLGIKVIDPTSLGIMPQSTDVNRAETPVLSGVNRPFIKDSPQISQLPNSSTIKEYHLEQTQPLSSSNPRIENYDEVPKIKKKNKASRWVSATIQVVTDSLDQIGHNTKKTSEDKRTDSVKLEEITRPKATKPLPKTPPPKDSAPKDSAPKDSAPKDSAPKDSAPKDSAPKDSAPKDSAPKDSAPKDSAPKDSAPKDSAPKDSAPKDAASKDSAPKDSASKDSPPEDSPQGIDNPTPNTSSIQNSGTQKSNAANIQETLNGLFLKACKELVARNYKALKAILLESYPYSNTSKDLNDADKILSSINLLADPFGQTLLLYAVKEKLEPQILDLFKLGSKVFSSDVMISENSLSYASKYIMTEHKNIFFILCQQAQIETKPNPKALSEYTTLHTLSKQVVLTLHQGFAEYNELQKERANSDWYNFLSGLAKLFGADHTQRRAWEVAEAYKYLFEIQHHQNYNQLIEQLQLRLNTSEEHSSGSVLHKIIRQALAVCMDIIAGNKEKLETELQTYTRNNPGFFTTQIATLKAELALNEQKNQADKEKQKQESLAREEKQKQESLAREEKQKQESLAREEKQKQESLAREERMKQTIESLKQDALASKAQFAEFAEFMKQVRSQSTPAAASSNDSTASPTFFS